MNSVSLITKKKKKGDLQHFAKLSNMAEIAIG